MRCYRHDDVLAEAARDRKPAQALGAVAPEEGVIAADRDHRLLRRPGGAARRQPRRPAAGMPRAGGRVRLRKDDARSMYLGPAPRLHRRAETAWRAPCAGCACPLPQDAAGDPVRLSEPVRLLEPAQDRGSDRGATAQALLRLPASRDRGSRPRRARAGCDEPVRRRPLPRPALRRREAASRDRPRPWLQALALDLRRGHVGARRLSSGRDRSAPEGGSSRTWA